MLGNPFTGYIAVGAILFGIGYFFKEESENQLLVIIGWGLWGLGYLIMGVIAGIMALAIIAGIGIGIYDAAKQIIDFIIFWS